MDSKLARLAGFSFQNTEGGNKQCLNHVCRGFRGETCQLEYTMVLEKVGGGLILASEARGFLLLF